MLKACSRCGEIHARNKCSAGEYKPRQIRESEADKFRNTQKWKRKTKYIKQRDMHLCQACIRGLYGTQRRYNPHNTSVHHIIPLATDFSKRLDNENLITLCRFHHEMAEKNIISTTELLKIADEQETRPTL